MKPYETLGVCYCDTCSVLLPTKTKCQTDGRYIFCDPCSKKRKNQMKLTTRPFRYQRKGIRTIDHFNGRCLVADEMGLGKTLQSLGWAIKAHQFPMVVVCPASLKLNWQREVHLHTHGVTSNVLYGRTPSEYIQQDDITIINYDILGGWLEYIKKLKPQTIVLDECQAVSNPGTKQSKNVKKMCKGIPNILGLSGTPFTNRPGELFPILQLIRPDIYNSFMGYAWKYCQPKKKPWGWEYKGAKDLDVLHSELKRFLMLRRRKRDVLLDLPEKSRFVVPLEITKPKEYHKAENDFIGWLTKKSQSKAKKAKKALAIVRMGYLKRLAARLKWKGVLDWVDNFLEASEGKLILFAVHKKPIKLLRERYRRRCVVIDGSTPQPKRMLAVDQFQKNKRIRILIGNIRAAGKGLNLTAASAVAFAEMGWTPGEHNQAEDRAHRIGQTRGLNCYYLVANGTIESDLCELIQQKASVFDSVFDGEKEVDTLDIFDQLQIEIKKRSRK